MTNELIFLLSIFIYFSLTLLSYKFFAKIGLYIWIVISIIYSNIEVLLLVNIFGITVTLGNVIYSSTFLATEILNEIYGTYEAKKSIFIGFFASSSIVILTTVTTLFAVDDLDFTYGSFKTIFSSTPKIVLASSITYLSSQFLDMWIFQKIKKITNSKYLWIRNNVSTFLSQLVDTTIFTIIAFKGIYATSTVLALIIPTFLIKVLISVLDTPFFYLATKIKPYK